MILIPTCLQGLAMNFRNTMDDFNIQKFNTRTCELIGRPELANSYRMKRLEAMGSICGVKQMTGYC
jgi:hypothetical protein